MNLKWEIEEKIMGVENYNKNNITLEHRIVRKYIFKKFQQVQYFSYFIHLFINLYRQPWPPGLH
jgi:hypothetical protein